MKFHVKIPNSKCIKELKEAQNMYGEFFEHLKFKVPSEDSRKHIFSCLSDALHETANAILEKPGNCEDV